MRKYLLLLLLIPFLFGFNWVTANQGTFQWDAVVANGGNPPGTHVEYEVFVIDSVTDIATVFEVTVVLQSTVTLPAPGRYWVGVKALLMDDGSGERLKESDLARSNLPEYCLNGATFGFQMWPDISVPPNLRP